MLMTSRSEIQRTSILPYQGLNLLEKLNNLNLEIFMKVSDQKEKKDKMKIVDEILSSIKAFNKTKRDRASTPKIEKKKAFEELLSKY